MVRRASGLLQRSNTLSSSAVLLISSSSEEDSGPPAPSFAAVTAAPAHRTTPPSPLTAGARGTVTTRGATRNDRRNSAAIDEQQSRAATVVRSPAAGCTTRVAAFKDFYESPPELRPKKMSPPPPSYHPGGGAGGSAGIIDGFFPSASRVARTPPRRERVATVGGTRDAQATRASTGEASVSPAPASVSGSVSPLGIIPQTTPPTNRGVALGMATTSPIFTPVSASPAAMTTTTVVTTVVGSPIMSTGLPRMSGGRVSSPVCTPPAFGSPPVAVSTRGRQGANTSPPEGGPKGASTSPPTRVLRPRRVAPPLPPTPGSEGASDDSVADEWTVALARSARRKARRAALSSSDEEVRGEESRVSAGPPPFTTANFPSLPARGAAAITSVVAAPGTSGRRAPLEVAREVAPVQRTVDRDTGHPIAPASVRGVMGRRGTPAAVGGRAGAARVTAAHGGVASGAARPPAVRRSPVRAGGRPRGVPVVAAGAERLTPRQRAAERERLVALAESAVTPADLDALMTQVVGFVGGSGQGGRVQRPRDRPDGRRGAGNGVRARAEGARDGANARRPAPAGRPEARQGEGGRDRGREAARIQALFRMNRRKAIREVLAGPAEVCTLPTERVQRYFEEVYSGGEDLNNAEPVELPEALGEGEESAALVAPLTEREVDRRLRRTNNSAPGPDGYTYRDLRSADPHGRLLAAVFNTCLRLRVVPSAWKTSNTVLVYKKGDRDRLENWRPLALGDTMPKLFAAVLADRLSGWAIANDKLSPAQKGFLRDEGCYEHNFVLQEILTDARRSRKEAVVAWLDLSNAFGSVPHGTIRRALVSAGVPASLIEIWGSMYDGCTTRVRTADGFTAPIVIRSGVRQGCPLSPIIFNLAIDSVLRAVTEAGPGLELMGSRWSVMAYADDLTLVSRTPTEMKQLLAVAEVEAASVGLRFNPAKCATLHVGGRAGGRVLPTPFEIQGQTVRALAEGEAYEHLGIPTGFSVNQTPHHILEALTEDLRSVDRSLLAPWQKSEAVATFLLPRLDFLLRGAKVEKGFLKAVDLHVRRLAKSWMNLPQRASAELVYIPPSRGGCGLLPMADLADVLTIAHVFRLLTADDRAVRDLAWASLRGVVHRRVGHPPSCDEVASFLSGSLEGNLRGGGESSLWSRARNAARRQSERCAIRWKWIEELEELVLECRGSRGRSVKIPPGARAQVIGRIRSAVAEYYTHTLLVKPDQGKVFEVSSRERVSNHFVRSGGFTRFADWRFIHRARLDVLPLNGARRWGDGDRRCRRCGENSETLPHVLCHCGPHSAAIQWRHDSILLRLKGACRLPGDVTVNQRVRGLEGELERLRPDLVIRHEPSKCVVICDVTVPFENRQAAFHEARARKIAKYSPMAEALRRLGYRVVVTAFVVGALGSWDPANEEVLRLLRVGNAYAPMMRRLMVSDTIRWSRDIYVEHVSGVRQYEAPPRRADGGCPDVPVPRAIRRRVTGARADGGDAFAG